MQNAEYWEQLSTLYNQVLEMDEETRTQFLDIHCPNPEVRTEIESLLNVQTQSFEYFDALSEKLISNAFEEFSDLPPQNERVDRYKIIEKIGRGGMGSVYLAERDDGVYESKVAIKVLRHGMDTADILARFRVERQILARMNHPNITHLLDGGITQDGRPYFVMEYVQGKPINSYCDENRLTIKDRVTLFLQICDALNYAHQNLVIHRDLKPGNILVTDEGQIKLLDFGIAKLLDEEPGNYHTIAEGGNRLLTPAFASPEQVKNIPINTSSDVYQLGVVLYLLFTGTTPLTFEGSTLQQIEAIILEEEPIKPSRKVFRMESAEVELVSQKRAVTPKKLRLDLKGDLDAIVMKALQKEPNQRYGSIQDLRDDLQRYLEGEPVSAQPATLGYRVGKFLKRNRTGALIVLFFMIMLFGFIAALINQQAVTAQERDRAFSEAEKAEQVTHFLIEVFNTADPNLNLGEQITAVEMLDRGVNMATNLDSQPELQIEMLVVAAEIYRTLGEYNKALDVIDKAEEQAILLYGEKHEVIAGLLNSRGNTLVNLGDFSTGKEKVEKALNLQRLLFGNKHPDVANTINNLSGALYSLGDYQEALRLNEEALEIQRLILRDTHPDIARTLTNQGVIRNMLAEHEEVREIHEEILTIRRASLGDKHLDVAMSLNNLGTVLMELEEFEEARQKFEEAMDIRKSILGSEHPEVATSLNNLGSVMIAMSDYNRAKEFYEEAIMIRRSVLGNEHPATINSLSNLGVVLINLGDLKEARKLYEEVVEMRRVALGNNHQSVAISMSNLGILLSRLEEYEEASKLHKEALNIFKTALGDEHPSVSVTLSNLGSALRDAGNLSEARSTLEEAVQVERNQQRTDHPSHAITLTNLAMTLQLQGEYISAKEILKSALDIQENALPKNHWRIMVTKNLIGVSLSAIGDHSEANKLLKEGYETLKVLRGPDDHYTIRAKINLNNNYQGL